MRFYMTDNEQRRESEQRRMADVVRQYDEARREGQGKALLIMIASCTFFGSILIWIAVSTAKDVVAPVNDRVTKIEVKVEQLLKMDEKIDKILDKMSK